MTVKQVPTGYVRSMLRAALKGADVYYQQNRTMEVSDLHEMLSACLSHHPEKQVGSWHWGELIHFFPPEDDAS